MNNSTLKNNPVEHEKTYTQITASFTEFCDLGTEYAYNSLQINSTLDVEVKLQFTNSEQENPEMTIEAGEKSVKDGFLHDNVIAVKYKTAAPTKGFLRLLSWRTL